MHPDPARRQLAPCLTPAAHTSVAASAPTTAASASARVTRKPPPPAAGRGAGNAASWQHLLARRGQTRSAAARGNSVATVAVPTAPCSPAGPLARTLTTRPYGVSMIAAPSAWWQPPPCAASTCRSPPLRRSSARRRWVRATAGDRAAPPDLQRQRALGRSPRELAHRQHHPAALSQIAAYGGGLALERRAESQQSIERGFRHDQPVRIALEEFAEARLDVAADRLWRQPRPPARATATARFPVTERRGVATTTGCGVPPGRADDGASNQQHVARIGPRQRAGDRRARRLLDRQVLERVHDDVRFAVLECLRQVGGKGAAVAHLPQR